MRRTRSSRVPLHGGGRDRGTQLCGRRNTMLRVNCVTGDGRWPGCSPGPVVACVAWARGGGAARACRRRPSRTTMPSSGEKSREPRGLAAVLRDEACPLARRDQVLPARAPRAGRWVDRSRSRPVAIKGSTLGAGRRTRGALGRGPRFGVR